VMISAVQLTNLRSQCGAPGNQASPRARRPRRIATILTLHQACPANQKEAGSLVRRQTVRTRAGRRSNPDHVAWAAAKDAASERQWLRLADASTDGHPADALAAYHTTIGSLKVHTGDDNYRRMVSLLLSARACHLALGTPDEFTRYVAALCAEQKRERNLMKSSTRTDSEHKAVQAI